MGKNMLPKTIIRSIYVVDDIYSAPIKNLGIDCKYGKMNVSLSKGKAVLTIVKMKKSGRF
jgi:hypothetical protein